jgi:peptidoglycan-associated lipoprotein
MTKSKSILVWAGLIVFAGLLLFGCAKKPEPVVEPDMSAYEDSLRKAYEDSLAEAQRLAREREEAERLAREEAERLAREAENAAKASLQIIYFDFDRYNLRTDARAAAEFDAGVLAEYTDWLVTIEGHCDERGTDEYNLALGERRANTVKEFLVNYGIDAVRLSTVSYGEERPANMGHNEDAWSLNRRAVLVVK